MHWAFDRTAAPMPRAVALCCLGSVFLDAKRGLRRGVGKNIRVDGVCECLVVRSSQHRFRFEIPDYAVQPPTTADPEQATQQMQAHRCLSFFVVIFLLF